MELSNSPEKVSVPFANAGARNNIPVGSQVLTSPSAASFTDGFPPLTRTPLAAGGAPPSGLDMNGILYELSALLQWFCAGGQFAYDPAFATSAGVNGYPKGARLMRADGKGYWFNTTDGNTVDPESATPGQAAAAGWCADMANGVTSVALSNANVTLTPAQYGLPVIVLTGTLTANLNLIFPSIEGEWTVINKCAGEFIVTCKTDAGTGVGMLPQNSRILCCDGVSIFAAQTKGLSFSEASGASIVAPTTVSLAQAGFWFQVTNAVPVTLPPLSKAPLGATYTFTTSVGFTLKGDGADIIQADGSVTVTNSLPVLAGESITVVANGSLNGWYVVIDGFGANAFPVLFATNGYQKLPTGLILQWGNVTQAGQSTVSYTLPIAYPNSALVAVANKGMIISTTNEPGVGSAATQTQITITNSSASMDNQGISWYSLGH